MIKFHFPESLEDTLNRIASKAHDFQTLAISEGTTKSLEHKLSIELTHGSTAIEGNTLTLRETQLLIDEGITPASSKQLRELHEVRNHDAALRQIQTWANDRDPIPLQGIRTIHSMVMKDIDDKTAGKFRDVRVMVTGAPLQPIRPEKIEEEMSELFVDIAIGKGHPLAVAIEAHYRFVKIHPFFDGNGRTARLLMNWILLKRGYPLVVIPGESRARYIGSIDRADLGEPADFCELICECAENSLDQYLEI